MVDAAEGNHLVGRRSERAAVAVGWAVYCVGRLNAAAAADLVVPVLQAPVLILALPLVLAVCIVDGAPGAGVVLRVHAQAPLTLAVLLAVAASRQHQHFAHGRSRVS